MPLNDRHQPLHVRLDQRQLVERRPGKDGPEERARAAPRVALVHQHAVANVLGRLVDPRRLLKVRKLRRRHGANVGRVDGVDAPAAEQRARLERRAAARVPQAQTLGEPAAGKVSPHGHGEIEAPEGIEVRVHGNRIVGRVALRLSRPAVDVASSTERVIGQGTGDEEEGYNGHVSFLSLIFSKKKK